MSAKTNLSASVIRLILIGLTILFGSASNATVDLDSRFEILGHGIYSDQSNKNIYYLAPETPRIATDKRGVPLIELSVTYYTGNETRKDVGNHTVNHLLTVVLESTPLAPARRAEVIKHLKKALPRSKRPIVRNLPVYAMPTSIEYAAHDTPERYIRVGLSDKNSGNKSQENKRSTKTNSANWHRKSLNFPLSPTDGQIMRRALEAGGALMSVSLGYETQGVTESSNKDSAEPELQIVRRIVEAAVFRVSLESKNSTDFVRILDVNSLSPPGFLSLEVHCYDFSGEPSNWKLELKEIEFEAQGVTEKLIRAKVEFSQSDSSNTLKRVNFPYAVRIDQPFRYRVTRFAVDGQLQVDEWVSVDSWVEPLDVSDYLETGTEVESP